MKSAKKKCERRVNRGKFIILLTLGVAFIVMPLILMGTDPIYIVAKYQARVAKDSEVYNILSSEISGAYVSAYLFNVTNAEDFLSGKDYKLKVEEIGPFTYQEKRLNKDFELDEEAQELRYSPYITITFIPELSIGDPKNINVTMPNVALLSITTAVSSYPAWTQMGLNLLTKQLGTESLLTMTAADYLWGYEEPLLAFGHTIMPGWINFRKMGLLDRLYDNTRDYRIELSVSNKDKFRIKRVNDYGGLPVWGYTYNQTRCNSFVDTYEGIAYTPGVTPDTPIRLYRNVFCRMLELEFAETRTVEYGPEAHLFRTSNRTFQRNADTECLCSKLGCYDGLSDISPCYYGLPVAFSNAHFYGANSTIYERIEGIAPDEKKHGGTFLIETKLGVALETSMTFQLNVPVSDVSFNRKARPFTNLIVPVAYFKVIQPELEDDLKEKLRNIYITGPFLLLVIEITMLTLGLIILAFATRLLYWNWIYGNKQDITLPMTSVIKCEMPLMEDRQKNHCST